ncbi:hypothetical protein [Geomicrobium sp. JCM 19055]|uniref:hypothetical protein n=1 Tax=Geomicrobium sp. JCM 19055 TaxID=1460649 RepID=UPI002236A681|nr:hypothetical protein [Geomicrobium sp. JCM 19055]
MSEEAWVVSEEDTEDTLEDYVFGEYDITSSPNDFNILTLYNFFRIRCCQNTFIPKKLCMGYW